MARITVNTDQVNEIATEISSLNQKLYDQLEESRTLFESLKDNWSGEAYESTRAAYTEFSGKYFQTYKDIIENYVTFLRQNVSIGYFDVETINISLSEVFK